VPVRRAGPAQTLSAIEAAEEADLAREELADFMKTRRAGSRRTAGLALGGVVVAAGAGLWLWTSRDEAAPAPSAALAVAKEVARPPVPPKVEAAAPAAPAEPPEPPAPAEAPPPPEAQPSRADVSPTEPPAPAKTEPPPVEPAPPAKAGPKPEQARVADPTKAPEPGPDYDALVKKGREAAAKGKWPKAVEAFEAAQREKPTAAVAFELGRVLFDAEKYPRAREAFVSAVRLDPKRAEAQFYLAVTNQSLGKDADARKAYEAALKAGLSGDRANEARKALKALR
jgi:tetratricopeptide (TPR) repeat protein